MCEIFYFRAIAHGKKGRTAFVYLPKDTGKVGVKEIANVLKRPHWDSNPLALDCQSRALTLSHWTIRISRENNVIQIDLPDSRSKLSMYIWAMFGVLGVPIRLIIFNIINKMNSKIGFEMSLIVVEAIRGRCASFTVLMTTVWEIFGRQTLLFY